MHSLLGGRPRNDVFLWVAEYICLILIDIARRFSRGVVKNYDIFLQTPSRRRNHLRPAWWALKVSI